MAIIKRFSYADGYHGVVDAQISGEVCDALSEKGLLTAANLVDVSRPEDAPLHSVFEWVDSVAAEKWREQQARMLIASIRIVVEGKEEEPIKAFFNLEVKEPEYKSLTAILENEDDTERMLRVALRELSAFRRKYGRLKALANVFNAIDQLEMDFSL